jgi:hypothetical protein
MLSFPCIKPYIVPAVLFYCTTHKTSSDAVPCLYLACNNRQPLAFSVVMTSPACSKSWTIPPVGPLTTLYTPPAECLRDLYANGGEPWSSPTSSLVVTGGRLGTACQNGHLGGKQCQGRGMSTTHQGSVQLDTQGL